MKRKIRMVVAIDLHNGIGMEGQLLYSIKKDMVNFVKVTKNTTVIMGRATYESIGKPLPKRTNIVISNNKEFIKNNTDDIIIVSSPKAAYQKADKRKDISIIGGQGIYEAFFNDADELHITRIFASKPADRWFPEFENIFYVWEKSERYTDLKSSAKFQFQIWKRTDPGFWKRLRNSFK